MTRSKRIRPVVEIAENRERDAARQLGVSRQSVAEQERRLEELLQYREEYNQRLTGEGSNRMGARKLQEYQGKTPDSRQGDEQGGRALSQTGAASGGQAGPEGDGRTRPAPLSDRAG